MTLTYFLKDKDSNRNHFGRLNVVISQTVTDRANISIVNIKEVSYCLKIGVFTFDHDSF